MAVNATGGITDHPTSLCELRRASWLPTYAEAPAGKLVTGFHHSTLIPHSSTLGPRHSLYYLAIILGTRLLRL
jgi:hypothetical protein